ncbi:MULTISPECIES: ATP-binding protein [Sphaerimonospora]|uniref:ATP-binding protein n=2 Tax=Sphaerimonospora TaxID=1792303 RepID=A0A8J3RCC8_9ACTN|nr:ATP-binding protein [Sphaerimonospora thailandensis]GIH71721.1 ATP-binding protein [Sphaerimonospora thailandensis]
MSEKPGSAGSLTRDAGFGWFLRTASESDTRTCPLRPQADSVGRAREVTRTTLRQWGLPELSEDASLVVSELVTNAVRYARYPVGEWSDHPITLVLLRIAPHVLLAVSDPSDRIPAPKEPDFISEHGRGLYIVETYSQAWGWDPLDHGGKAVWALLRSSA